MTQSQLPHIWGADWKPRAHLDFESEVEISDVKGELIRFIAERHDGHLRLVSWIFDEVSSEYEEYLTRWACISFVQRIFGSKIARELVQASRRIRYHGDRNHSRRGVLCTFPEGRSDLFSMCDCACAEWHMRPPSMLINDLNGSGG